MFKQIRKLLDLYELLNERLDGLYAIKEISSKAILCPVGMNQEYFGMTDCEYKFHIACRSAFLCLPEEIRRRMREIIAR